MVGREEEEEEQDVRVKQSRLEEKQTHSQIQEEMFFLEAERVILVQGEYVFRFIFHSNQATQAVMNTRLLLITSSP